MNYKRNRRLRQSQNIRDLIADVKIDADDFMMPFFIIDGINKKEEIVSMPGVYRYTVDLLIEEIKKCIDLGIKSIILFGVVDENLKTSMGNEAFNDNGIIQKAVRKIKSLFSNVIVAVDICLCEYTNHGHCGIVHGNEIINDETLPILAKAAVNAAKAGADIIAPSDMMDGRIQAIRTALNDYGFFNTIIMSYSVKYASAFYGPFREAAKSAPCFSDRKTYQMDYKNSQDYIKELNADIDEDADILMIKPALAYLDIIKSAKELTNLPIAAFNVSGEFSMVKSAAKNGYIDEKSIVFEILTAIKRAGADIIITYHAMDAVRWLKNNIINY
jgi:Delta-aminolevulinic acid dehydratase